MEYNFTFTEDKWQKYWQKNKTFKTSIDRSRPKFYILDMFPYPSGAGLHVGHPLGYIASDIYSRYKMLKGYNVLHPMGYDAYGLPAEQYAIQTGTHPAITTEKNVARYREQMDKIGFCYDWDREVKTCDPAYYKWTQWTFIQLFNHWYDKELNRARPIAELVTRFTGENPAWKGLAEKEQQEILMNYRLAYLSEAMVNWCPTLGTVLANDEVVNGFSVRGGHPVERKMMRQWFLRISAYAQRLLDGLENIEWSDSLKEIQRYWIGRSEGAEVLFPIRDSSLSLDIFTTRPDTIFGSTFMVLAPEHEYIPLITTPDRKAEVEEYVSAAVNRSERERMSEVKKITGVFTGAYCINPLNDQPVPIWVADYVLAGYGTGAIMAVPAHDSRDYEFRKYFGLPIIEVVSGGDISESSYDAKDGILVNSGFINGMNVKDAVTAVIHRVEEMGIGTGKVNFRLRDAIFSRQRYWGEPFPVYYKDGMPVMLDESELPLLLPPVDAYLPTETGEPPLARAKNWKTKEGYPLETNTMPGFAGSSGYYLRYMDPQNDHEYFSREAAEYWQNVDLYMGGAEHATGHLIYARFWNKFLFDIGLVLTDEPFKKLINQGMIQGVSQKAKIISWGNINDSNNPVYILPTEFDFFEREFYYIQNQVIARWVNIPIEFVKKIQIDNEPKDILTNENLSRLKEKYSIFNSYFIATVEDVVKHPIISNPERNQEERNKDIASISQQKHLFSPDYVSVRPEVEKMSKSKYNVVNPDEMIAEYGADTLRLYEMFLGPLEQSKPWDTKGVEGVFRFIRKFWRLFHDAGNVFRVTEDAPSQEEYRALHKAIKKTQEDIERFSFNTVVSTFMICTNELTDLKCSKRTILEPLVILVSPFAPHLTEELWEMLGHRESVSKAAFPVLNEEYLSEDTFNYPVSFNGKMRFTITLPLDMPPAEIEQAVLTAPESQKWLHGNPPKKVIVVPKKIVNIVL